MSGTVIEQLLTSDDPTIVYKTRRYVLGQDPGDPELMHLQQNIKNSHNVRSLLQHRNEQGQIMFGHRSQVYRKWQGPHWTLVCLAELDYPPGDDSLRPLWQQCAEHWAGDRHLKKNTTIYPGQEDRVRRCASQEANAVWSSLKLGLADHNTDELVTRLLRWQWPDGGWNCDRRLKAHISSFHESLVPLRAMALYGQICNHARALAAASKAAEFFLERKLMFSKRTGQRIDDQFVTTAYPYFFPYTVFFGLKVLTECGIISDPRCVQALDWLESIRLADGTFPLLTKYYKQTDQVVTRGTFAEWGPTGKRRGNPHVTVEALHILTAAGRLQSG